MEIDPTYLAFSFAFSAAGFALFLRGKKTQQTPHLLAGIALMTCSFFITNVVAMTAVCLPLAIAPFFVPEA
ncbi:MAG TPA: hypothetical protein VER17_13325 [Tepidisphaeraceae bacterium]|nr:hypothetical protein [Tepidisphaeraceae bacterium]